MITATDRYQRILEATQRTPPELLAIAATLVDVEPTVLVAQPEVVRWLDDVYSSLPLAEHGIERLHLMGELRDRLSVHLAAEAARAGAGPDVVLALLWPADGRRGSRCATAPRSGLAALWPALKDYLARAVAGDPWDGVVEVFSSDRAAVAALSPDPPEYRGYFRELEYSARCRLDDRFVDAMRCEDAVEPGWLDDNVLPALHPAGAFAYVAWLHSDREKLLELVEHPTTAIASAALVRLERARPASELAMDARERRAERERGRCTDDAIDDVVARHTAECTADAAFRDRLIGGLVRPPSRFAHRLPAYLGWDEWRTPAGDALQSLPTPQLESIVDMSLAEATATGRWTAVADLANLIAACQPTLHAKLVSGHLTSWHAEPMQDGLHASVDRVALLSHAYLRDASDDAAAFDAAAVDGMLALVRRLEGRHVGLGTKLIDELVARLYAAACDLGTDRVVLLDRLRRVVRRWRGAVVEQFDGLCHHVLGRVDPAVCAEVDASVSMLHAAANNEGLSHAWPVWVPEQAELRGVLLPAMHTAFLHDVARFLANTARHVNGEAELYQLLLDTTCPACEEIAFRRLDELGGAVAALANAVLDNRVPHVESEIQRALALAFPSLPWQRLRRSIIDAAVRRTGARVDETAFGWARRIEATGLTDNSNQWSWRRA